MPMGSRVWHRVCYTRKNDGLFHDAEEMRGGRLLAQSKRKFDFSESFVTLARCDSYSCSQHTVKGVSHFPKIRNE